MLNIVKNLDITQNISHFSFIGGIPRMPKEVELPNCRLCGKKQSFFMQIEFPSCHEWEGKTLAIFLCTECAYEDNLIPEMLKMKLEGVDIPEGYLNEYQKNFKFLVFDSSKAALRMEYVTKVRFAPIEFEEVEENHFVGSKIGGTPVWPLDNESPESYANKYQMCFLYQFEQNYQFEVINGAKHQMELNLEGKPVQSEYNYYQLFLGNSLYFFGTKELSNPLVYVITQV